MKTYPGGKGLSFRNIINLIPPHEVYIETHLGGGAVMRHKKPAKQNIGIDIDAQVIAQWENTPALVEICDLYCQSAHDFLRNYDFTGHELVYCDPPYLRSTRRGGKIYRHEYGDEDHLKLLYLVKTLPCKVLVSGYRNVLYEESLSSWNRQCFTARTRAGIAEECVWFNYPQPSVLHDHRYLGSNFREREKIRRRMENLKRKIASLPIGERHEILSWITTTEDFNNMNHY
jgi:phage DNA methylase